MSVALNPGFKVSMPIGLEPPEQSSMDRMAVFKESMGLVEISFIECKDFKDSMSVFFTKPALILFVINLETSASVYLKEYFRN